MEMTLVWPAGQYLPSYVAALERGWSPDNVRGSVAAREELERIASDAAAFLASLVDRAASGHPIILPDATTVPRLPGYRRRSCGPAILWAARVSCFPTVWA